MYARNLFNFLQPAITDGGLVIDWTDEVFAGAVLTHDGIVRHEATGQATRRMPAVKPARQGEAP
jgi:NAD(P) transhydrogenase subunit alpha